MILNSKDFVRGIAGLGLAVVAGCGSNDTVDVEDVNEDTIYQRISVDYTASSKDVDIYVQLRVGGSTGTTVAIQDDQALLVNNMKMEETDGRESSINLSGTSYGLASTADSTNSNYRIIWNRKDGQQVATDVRLAPAYEFAEDVQSKAFSISEPLTFAMKTEKDDSRRKDNTKYSYRCTLTTPDGNAPEGFQSRMSSSNASASSCEFSVADLMEFPLGEAVLSSRLVATSKEGQIKNMTGRSISRTYMSAEKRITLTN